MLNSLADVKYYTEITYFPEIVSASNKHLIFEVQIAPSKMWQKGELKWFELAFLSYF